MLRGGSRGAGCGAARAVPVACPQTRTSPLVHGLKVSSTRFWGKKRANGESKKQGRVWGKRCWDELPNPPGKN